MGMQSNELVCTDNTKLIHAHSTSAGNALVLLLGQVNYHQTTAE